MEMLKTEKEVDLLGLKQNIAVPIRTLCRASQNTPPYWIYLYLLVITNYY